MSQGTSHISARVIIMARIQQADGSYTDVPQGSIEEAKLKDAMAAAALDPVDPATAIPADRTPEEIRAEKNEAVKQPWYKRVWANRKTVAKYATITTVLVVTLYALDFLIAAVLRRRPVITEVLPTDQLAGKFSREAVIGVFTGFWTKLRTNTVGAFRWIKNLFTGNKAAVPGAGEVVGDVMASAAAA